MGGLHSEVSDRTTSVLLESARFDPLRVRRTARALAMKSDSSYRFERGIDPTLRNAPANAPRNSSSTAAASRLPASRKQEAQASPPSHHPATRAHAKTARHGYPHQ